MLAQAAAVAGASHDPHVLLIAVPLAAVSGVAYARWLRPLRAHGGRVSTEHFFWPDLIIAGLLAALFGAAGWLAFAVHRELPPLNLKMLLEESLANLVILAFLVGLLAFRKAGFGTIFGVRNLPPAKILGRAALFLLAALPAVYGMSLIMSNFGVAPDEQLIVKYFREEARIGHYQGIAVVVFTASIMAPVWEELAFRGYLYGTLKHYFGPVASAVFVSALFAALHGNLTSLPPLFALALCLTAAYEWSGSILVPMTMHLLFNSMSLFFLYWQATHSPP